MHAIGILFVDISRDMFTSIQRPELVAPDDQAMVHTLNPVLQYQLSVRRTSSGELRLAMVHCGGVESTLLPI